MRRAELARVGAAYKGPSRAAKGTGMDETRLEHIEAALDRIATALGAPPANAAFDPSEAQAFIWRPEAGRPVPVQRVNRVPLALIRGVDHVRDQLVANTRRFGQGLPANNVLLWGARGMGKSSLVKAAHAEADDGSLKLIEIHREDIGTLPDLLAKLAGREERFVLFCDDLSFDHDDGSYKSLKAVLEGGVEGRPENVVFYATSNRRHLLPRDMMENERSTAINPSEAVEEKVSLSDRFGLWLGFHKCDQATYLDMVAGYVVHHELPIAEAEWRPRALEWATTRGSRSGRVAQQFVQALAGELGVPLCDG